MALRDHIKEILAATPEDAQARRAALNEALSAVGEDAGDEALLHAVADLIAAREQKAGSYAQAGQFDLSKRVREEIAALREVLRHAQATEPDAPAKPVKIPKADLPAPDEVSKPLFSRRQTIMAAVAGGVVAIAAIVWVAMSWSGKSVDEDSAAPQEITRYEDDHVLGDPKAPVTLLEYAAPTCPHCAHFFTAVFPTIKKEYIDTGKVFYIFRVLPIMSADGAAEAIARCLPADKYFAFLDHLFRNQTKWDPEYGITDVRGSLIRLSRVAGLNATQVEACLANQAVVDRMNDVAKEGADKYGLRSVPTFIIDGVAQKPGSMEVQEMRSKLDAALAKKNK